MSNEQHEESVPTEEVESPPIKSNVGGKEEWEKNMYRAKFREGQKVWERIARNQTDGPYTVVRILCDDPETFRYKVKSEDGLVFREIYEKNLQKRQT
ncbi:MAG: hypothetical protein M1813_001760 [Trichoglossum hirsutum]|nr:MAG: hypothetical protein M1813_001760 [Trichoglossum hirsutum]